MVLRAVLLPAIAASLSSYPAVGMPAMDKGKPTQASPGNPKFARIVSPGAFSGEVRAAYKAANAIPEILDQMFCYCGCDITDGHCSLLDCYLSNHGVDCRECKSEALTSLKMHRSGSSIEAIRQKLHDEWKKSYIFKTPTPAYKRYLDTHKLPFDHSADAMDLPPPGSHPPSSCCQGEASGATTNAPEPAPIAAPEATPAAPVTGPADSR